MVVQEPPCPLVARVEEVFGDARGLRDLPGQLLKSFLGNSVAGLRHEDDPASQLGLVCFAQHRRRSGASWLSATGSKPADQSHARDAVIASDPSNICTFLPAQPQDLCPFCVAEAADAASGRGAAKRGHRRKWWRVGGSLPQPRRLPHNSAYSNFGKCDGTTRSTT